MAENFQDSTQLLLDRLKDLELQVQHLQVHGGAGRRMSPGRGNVPLDPLERPATAQVLARIGKL